MRGGEDYAKWLGRIQGGSARGSGATVAAALAIWSLRYFVFVIQTGRLLGPEGYGLASALRLVGFVIE